MLYCEADSCENRKTNGNYCNEHQNEKPRTNYIDGINSDGMLNCYFVKNIVLGLTSYNALSLQLLNCISPELEAKVNQNEQMLFSGALMQCIVTIELHVSLHNVEIGQKKFYVMEVFPADRILLGSDFLQNEVVCFNGNKTLTFISKGNATIPLLSTVQSISARS